MDLATPGAQDTGGAGSDTLVSVENLAGSPQSDVLKGDGGDNGLSGGAGNDTLTGSGGNDALDGGSGTGDTASYSTAGSAVDVDLSDTGAQPTGGAGSDTILAVENLTGSPQADTLTGDSTANVLNGGAGNDTLIGGLGNDTLDGSVGTADVASYSDAISPVLVDLSNGSAQPTGMGSDTLASVEGATGGFDDDTLIGSGGDNPIDGGPGNDTLTGDLGDDTLTGGGGTDTADYSTATGPITADLSLAGAQPTDGAGDDTLVQIANLTGSPENDDLTGNGGSNELAGGDGDDNLEGAGGNDIVSGGPGTDTADYSAAPAGVAVDLSSAGAQATGGAGSDSLAGMEDLVGSALADTLTGSSDTNSISAGDGDDTVRTLDSVADEANCGAGTDAINADALDTVDPDCESVTIGTPPAPPPPSGGGGGGPAAPDTTAPVLSGVSVPLMRSGIGGPVTYILSEPSRVTFKWERVLLGRRVKGKCVRATKRNRKRRSCRRYITSGTSAHQGGGGQNVYAFPARLGSNLLKPGPYRVTAQATDAAGNRSRQIIVKFAVTR